MSLRRIFLSLLFLHANAWAVEPILDARVIIQKPAPLPEIVSVGQAMELTILVEGQVGLFEYRNAILDEEGAENMRLVPIGPLLFDQKSLHVELERGNLAITATAIVTGADDQGIPPFKLRLTGDAGLEPLSVTTQAVHFTSQTSLKNPSDSSPVWLWPLLETGGISVIKILICLAIIIILLGAVTWTTKVAIPRWRNKKILTPFEKIELQTEQLLDLPTSQEYAFACVSVLKQILEFLEEQLSPDLTDSEILEYLKRILQKTNLAKKTDTILSESFAIRYAKAEISSSERQRWQKIILELLEQAREKDLAAKRPPQPEKRKA